MNKVFNDVRNLDAYRLQLQFMHDFSRPLKEFGGLCRVRPDMHINIADAYDAMIDEPLHPEVKRCYNALVLETKLQYIYITGNGYKIELHFDSGEPYGSSMDMLTDLIHNKRLKVLPTVQDFGEAAITDHQRELSEMLKDSGQIDANGVPMLNNDLFRAVHDFFGHSVMGNSFGPVGEENAWREHIKMYSKDAAKAMTVETRGQNSWVNFGQHLRIPNTDILRKKDDPEYLQPSIRPFAPQKIGLLPDWCADLY